MSAKPGLVWYDWLVGTVLIFLFCLTLALNVLALHYTYTKLRKPSLKKIPHLLVGALSLAGLGVAVFLYPPFIASHFNGELKYEAGVCEFVAFSVLFFGTLTISLVVAMGLERLAAIVFPFCYKERMTFRKSVLGLVFVVLYSLATAVLPIALRQVQLNMSTGVCTYAVDSHNFDTQFVVYTVSTHYVLSVLLMLVANVVVVYTMYKLDRNSLFDAYHDQRCKESTAKCSSTSACLSFAKMVAIMTVCYGVCWTAILLRILLIFAYNWHSKYFDQVVLVLTTLDPLINHVVCLVTMVKYREGYARALGRLCTFLRPGEEGMWRSAITRISSISRSYSTRSSSMRSSHRRSSAHTYKQVPQNAAGRKPGDDIEIQSDPKELREKVLGTSDIPAILGPANCRDAGEQGPLHDS